MLVSEDPGRAAQRLLLAGMAVTGGERSTTKL